MLDTLTFKISENDVSTRIDRFVCDNCEEITRSAAQQYIESGNVLVCGKAVNKNYKLRLNDEVSVTLPEPVELDVVPEDIPLDIVFEDEHLLVVNKPKGMVVHPAVGNFGGTLVNALLFHCKGNLSGINGVIRPGIVHRIDKNTSGLLIVAKTNAAHLGLAEQIKEHSFTRIYEAVVYGNIKDENGVINAPIGRHPTDRKKMCVTAKNSKEAITHFEVVNRYNGFTHLRLKLETGRTHQIRVHLSHLGHAVAGDDVYGPKKCITALGGQCLHAKVIGFVHPITHEQIYFESPLPDYFTQFLKTLNDIT